MALLAVEQAGTWSNQICLFNPEPCPLRSVAEEPLILMELYLILIILLLLAEAVAEDNPVLLAMAVPVAAVGPAILAGDQESQEWGLREEQETPLPAVAVEVHQQLAQPQ